METQKQGAIPEEAETTKELLGVQESSTRGKNCLSARKEPDPAESAGGDAPPCAEPPAAPTLYQSTAEPYYISLSIIAESFSEIC